MARENRLKKKRYINGLEESLAAAKKQNENLETQLKNKDAIIENLKKEVIYFKSILANVQEISSLIRTVKQETSLPLTTSLPPAENPLKRCASDAFSDTCFKPKVQRLSESSGECSSIFDEEEDMYSWMPLSPLTSTIDQESIELLSNFNEGDLDLSVEDSLQPKFEVPDSVASIASTIPGVCLHVQNKKMSLEFCSSCASKALEKWMIEA